MRSVLRGAFMQKWAAKQQVATLQSPFFKERVKEKENSPKLQNQDF